MPVLTCVNLTDASGVRQIVNDKKQRLAADHQVVDFSD